MQTVWLRLRDLALTALCAASASLAAILFLGKWKFEGLFEAALGGRTVLWAVLAAAVATGCATGFVLGKPPCKGPNGKV
jgi:hypothetical protein